MHFAAHQHRIRMKGAVFSRRRYCNKCMQEFFIDCKKTHNPSLIQHSAIFHLGGKKWMFSTKLVLLTMTMICCLSFSHTYYTYFNRKKQMDIRHFLKNIRNCIADNHAFTLMNVKYDGTQRKWKTTTKKKMQYFSVKWHFSRLM